MIHRLGAWIRELVTAERDGSDSVWDAIPRWQYDGRHAESGGLARGEQESALSDVQRQADERDVRDRPK